eukprot:scaffold922_cov327-Pinguiococcus_pyrenoidosus.AAC.38
MSICETHFSAPGLTRSAKCNSLFPTACHPSMSVKLQERKAARPAAAVDRPLLQYISALPRCGGTAIPASGNTVRPPAPGDAPW